MTSIHSKLNAIETEISRKVGELHVVMLTLREAKQTTAELDSAVKECQQRLAAVESAESPIESEVADIERDLLAKAVVRTQQRRQLVQRQLAEHLQRDEEVRKAIDKAKINHLVSTKKTMELRREQRKLERDLQEVVELKRTSILSLETSSRRTKTLATKSARLSALVHDEILRRDSIKAECVDLAAKHDALSNLLTDASERCSKLFSLFEHSPPLADGSALEANASTVCPSLDIVDESLTEKQSHLIAEYRTTIERLLVQTTA
jgi:chromosome segregation ATPase